MRDKKQIARFGQSVNSKLSDLRQILPADLILAHTSDQPLQVNGEHPPVPARPCRSHHSRRYCFAAWILGVAPGADHGARHTHYTRDDFRRCIYVGNRSATSFHRNANHRARPSRGRAGGRR